MSDLYLSPGYTHDWSQSVAYRAYPVPGFPSPPTGFTFIVPRGDMCDCDFVPYPHTPHLDDD